LSRYIAALLISLQLLTEAGKKGLVYSISHHLKAFVNVISVIFRPTCQDVSIKNLVS